MDSGAAIDTIPTSTKALPSSSKYDRKPLVCSSTVSNPIMTVRYSEQLLPGYIRFYDDSLNPQIDSLDYVYIDSSNSKFSEPVSDSHIQPQRRISADVDLCDHRPPLLPRNPMHDLDHPRIEVCRPVAILADPQDLSPVFLPSSLPPSPPPVYLWEWKAPSSILSLHGGHRPPTVENFTQFNMPEHLQQAPPYISDLSALITPVHHPPRRMHALPAFPPSLRRQRPPQQSLLSHPWMCSIFTIICSSWAQFFVHEHHEKVEIQKELRTLHSLMSTHVEALRLIDTVFATNDVYRQDGLETRVQSLTCQGYNQPSQYRSILTLCPTLAYTAHSIDITLYSRCHILQMQEQLDKGILRNTTVLHMPREINIHDDLSILRISRLRSISVQLWDHHSKPDISSGFPDLGLLEWWI
ncbi:hypothetical protein EV421DRAFT_1937025 [Armillaria borealis]|uniref:Uncharacterized protein n=1 Tax=Armillaria borealis TaxID=47425 RepID=A0AA39IVX3_9AGAR|nr:hypothetical protein EV421DRAFT_1937025 [Armillaria borealis]